MSWDLINTKYKIYKQWYNDVKKIDSKKNSKRLLLIDSLKTFVENVVLGYNFPVKSHKDAIHLKEEREFLFYRIIDGLKMDDVAFNMSISRDTAYRINRRIINRKIDFDSIMSDLMEREDKVITALKDDSSQLENPIIVILTSNDVNIDQLKTDLLKLGYKFNN